MISNRLRICGFISAAAAVSGALAGCGGSQTPAGAPPTLPGTGGLTSAPGTSTPNLSSGSTPQSVPVMVNGTSYTGILPANETIPANGVVSTLPPGQPIFNSMEYANKTHGNKGAPTTGQAGLGEVDVDGCNTGVTLTSAGSLSGYLVLAPGNHTITMIGPFDVVGNNPEMAPQLTVGQFSFGTTVSTDGTISIPLSMNFHLPANGGALRNGNFITLGYPTPDFAGGTGTITIVWPDASYSKTKPFVNGSATFEDLATNAAVPTSGITSISINYNH